MKQQPTALLPYVLLLAADFYLLPLLIRDTGSAMLLLLCVMPVAAFVTAAACGVYNGFGMVLPMAALLIFLPTVFLYYNASAWVYAPAYAVVVLAGVGLGGFFHGKR